MPTITDYVDLLLDEDGDLVVSDDLRLSSGLSAVSQSVRIRLQTFMGEWFLDLSLGVPYYQSLLGHRFSVETAQDVFRKEILASRGVSSVTKLEVSFDAAARRMSVYFEADTIHGSLSDNVSAVIG